MYPRHKETLSVAEQAAEWLLIMESPSAEERAAFWNWLDASPLHVRELILAVKTQRRLRGFDRAREFDVAAILTRARSNIAHIGDVSATVAGETPKSRWRYAAAACFALITVAVAAYWTTRDPRHTYSTDLGQQLVFELEDGSVVYLNTHSRIKVRFSERARDVYLPEGQALFEVKHDRARPFRVHTASSIVEAVGTQFDVRVMGAKTVVSVLEGVVQVLQPETHSVTISMPSPRLSAGESATVNAEGQVERTAQVDVNTVSAWKQQRLVFNEETLGWIADEFNRYNAAPRLRVEGDALRSRKFNGVFNAHSPESLVEYLQQDPAIHFERKEGEIVIREGSGAPADTVDAQPR